MKTFIVIMIMLLGCAACSQTTQYEPTVIIKKLNIIKVAGKDTLMAYQVSCKGNTALYVWITQAELWLPGDTINTKASKRHPIIGAAPYCVGVTKKGTPCKRKTNHFSGLCPTHRNNQHY
jgi:hypothetical protein